MRYSCFLCKVAVIKSGPSGPLLLLDENYFFFFGAAFLTGAFLAAFFAGFFVAIAM